MCNSTNCFAMAIMVMWMRLNVTLICTLPALLSSCWKVFIFPFYMWLIELHLQIFCLLFCNGEWNENLKKCEKFGAVPFVAVGSAGHQFVLCVVQSSVNVELSAAEQVASSFAMHQCICEQVCRYCDQVLAFTWMLCGCGDLLKII